MEFHSGLEVVGEVRSILKLFDYVKIGSIHYSETKPVVGILIS